MKLFKRIFLIAILVLIIILIIILIPFLLDWCVFGGNLTNSDWANFLGAYIGSIISIIGVLFTVYYSNKKMNEQLKKTNEQIGLQRQELEEQKHNQEEQKRFSNIPVLDVKISKVLEMPEENAFDFCLVEYEIFEHKNIVTKTLNANLSITNIGIGPAIDLKFACNSEYFNGHRISWNNEIRTIRPNEEKIKCFSFQYPQLDYIPDKKTARDYKFDLIIYYKDILGNSYAKTTKLSFFTENYITEDAFGIWFNIVDEDLGKLEEEPIEKMIKQAESQQKELEKKDS